MSEVVSDGANALGTGDGQGSGHALEMTLGDCVL